jgi:hypothetical protein
MATDRLINLAVAAASLEVRRYGSPVTLDPYFYSAAALTLSNGNRTMIKTAAGNSDHMARANVRIDDGAYYWEVAVIASGANRFNMIGIVPENAPMGWYPGQGNIGYGYYGNDGRSYGLGGRIGFGATFAAGDVIGVAYHARKGLLHFAKNNTWQSAANPVTDANPGFSNVQRSMFPAASIHEGSSVSQLKFNFKQSDCVYSAPAGFSYLDS